MVVPQSILTIPKDSWCRVLREFRCLFVNDLSTNEEFDFGNRREEKIIQESMLVVCSWCANIFNEDADSSSSVYFFFTSFTRTSFFPHTKSSS